jgi:hypothetical protein
MSLHTNYQPAKRGLIDAQIKAAKSLRAIKNGFKNARPNDYAGFMADFQRSHLKYSDQGDFTRCYRGGF